MVGHGAIDRRDGFAFMEVCHGGYCYYCGFSLWVKFMVVVEGYNGGRGG